VKRSWLPILFVAPLFGAVAPGAQAAEVFYGVNFTVEYTMGAMATSSLGTQVAVGNTYYGSFAVDDTLLAADGMNLAGSVSAFNITMEDVSWTLGAPSPASEFAGFRGPGGLGAASPGFDVQGGQIVNLRGGVFGGADYPFVDFSTDARLPSAPLAGCTGAYCGNRTNAFFTANSLGAYGGSMGVYAIAAAVPEPEPTAMVLGGFALVALASWRRRSAARTS
jgi:hypothetical protein